MLHFKPIELEDKKIIDSFLENNQCPASECCFSNLYGWAHKFDTRYAIWNDFLLIKFTREDGGCSYLKPIGKGDLRAAIMHLYEDCGCKVMFNLAGVTQEMWQEIDAAASGEFEFALVEGNFDYIYASEKLITLAGKKMQSKRNHLNRFQKENPDWKYISLNEQSDFIDQCKTLLKNWIDANQESHDDSLQLDYRTTMRFLNHFEELGLRGGAICVNGELQAFSLGTKLTEDTFIVHVEKALTELHGTYTIMNQQFAQNECAEFAYINREEDMGLESLRKAKMSYKPDILLEKGVVRFKQFF